jgi:hypothetical protein
MTIATETRIRSAPMTIRAVIDSSSTIAPRAIATTGLTYA